MHCDTEHAVARTRRAAEMLLAQKPDVVFLTGDYITKQAHRWAVPAAEALAPLRAVPGGVFCVLGNHDWGNYHWLARSADLSRRRWRGRVHGAAQPGRALVRRRRASGWSAWTTGTPAGRMWRGRCDCAARRLQVLLVHEPDYADEAPEGFALQLSGHSHGGQIRVPGLPPLHVPKYSTHYPEGLQQGPRHPVYTTRGVGTTGPPVRLFCPPEVTVLHLHRA